MQHNATHTAQGHAGLQVPRGMVKPNLHIAKCRLPRQERQRGPAARHVELWMERGMRVPKMRCKNKTVSKCEITYLCHSQMSLRGLQQAMVVEGMLSGENLDQYGQPRITVRSDTSQPLLLGAAMVVTSLSRTAKRGVTAALARRIITAACVHSRGTPAALAAAVLGAQDVLAAVLVTAHGSTQLPGYQLRSAAASDFVRTFDSSFVSVHPRKLVPLRQLDQRLTGPAEVVYVHTLVQLEPHAVGGSDDGLVAAMAPHAALWKGPYAVVERLGECKRIVFVSTPLHSADAPHLRLAHDSLSLYIVRAHDLLEQQMVLRQRADSNRLHFLQCADRNAAHA